MNDITYAFIVSTVLLSLYAVLLVPLSATPATYTTKLQPINHPRTSPIQKLAVHRFVNEQERQSIPLYLMTASNPPGSYSREDPLLQRNSSIADAVPTLPGQLMCQEVVGVDPALNILKAVEALNVEVDALKGGPRRIE